VTNKAPDGGDTCRADPIIETACPVLNIQILKYLSKDIVFFKN
jgi:hypothetical protein